MAPALSESSRPARNYHSLHKKATGSRIFFCRGFKLATLIATRQVSVCFRPNPERRFCLLQDPDFAEVLTDLNSRELFWLSRGQLEIAVATEGREPRRISGFITSRKSCDSECRRWGGGARGPSVGWFVLVHLRLLLAFSAVNTGFLAFGLGPFKSPRQRGAVFIDLLVRLVPHRFLHLCLGDGPTLECWEEPSLAFFRRVF